MNKTIIFDKAMYNHGNKGPSKLGFRLTVSTNKEDWFNYREYLLCKGFTVQGQMFKEDFRFEVIDCNTYKFTLLNDKKEYSAENPLQLLKKVYPNKSLSANAMLVFGSPAVQKIASVISGQTCSANYNEMYNDKYYSEARKTLKNFLEDFQNNDLQETYIMNGDWSWDKKSSQKRELKSQKTSQKISQTTYQKTTKKRSMLEEYEDEMSEYDKLFPTITRKRKTIELKENESIVTENNDEMENESIVNENVDEMENEPNTDEMEHKMEDENESKSNVHEVEDEKEDKVPLNDLSSFVWTFELNNDPSFKPIDPELESLFEK
jgi:HD superfamily phosphohydrolase